MSSVKKRPIALVIGGTSGIGAAIADKFGLSGYEVIVSGRDEGRGFERANKINKEGGQATFYKVDVASKDSIIELRDIILERHGIPNVLVNSAGILQSGKAVLDQEEDENDRVWETNYKGTFLACQIFGKDMRDNRNGCILNIGSLASFAPLSLPSYTPGKAAILSLTQILAAELGPFNVRVNAVAPGYTLSDGLKQKIAQKLRNPDAIVETSALKRFVMPEDIAEAAFFLCSDLAPTITGVVLPVDAGWLVQAPYAAYLQGNPIKKA